MLFAVNVTAVLPVTPSNLGVFQAACVAVLTGAYGIPAAQALGYGIILQAVEIATAVVMGAPALVKEGVSWREVRLRGAPHVAGLARRTPRRSAPKPERQFLILRCVGALMRRTLIALIALLVLAPAASAQERHEHSANMRHVKNLPYAVDNGGTPNYGTDIEFATLAGKKYALAGSYKNGLQIVDISNPDDAQIVVVYDCGVTQGDVQVFRQADEPGRTFVAYTSDTFGDGTSTCYREAQALGFDVLKEDGTGQNGTFIADVTDPLHPRTVGFVEVAPGLAQPDRAPERQLPLQLELGPDHVDPAGDRGLRHLRPRARPKSVGELALPPRPGLGTESHDITFNDDGTRAYSAALSQGVIIDTRDPAEPAIISQLPRPDDQRLAPDGPVHDHRRERPRARVPDRRGRVRGRASAPASARTAACTCTRSTGEIEKQPAEGRLLEHRHARPDRPGRRHAAPPTSSTSTRTRRS